MSDAIREGLVQRKSLLIRTHRKQKFPPRPPRCLLLCSSPNKKLSEHARVPHKNNSICSLFFQRQTRQSDRSVPKRSDGATTVRQSVCRLHLKHLSVASFPPPFFLCRCSPWRGAHLRSFTLRRSHLRRLEVSRGHTGGGGSVLGLSRLTKGPKSTKVTAN